jgi:hypothetical protein
VCVCVCVVCLIPLIASVAVLGVYHYPCCTPTLPQRHKVQNFTTTATTAMPAIGTLFVISRQILSYWPACRKADPVFILSINSSSTPSCKVPSSASACLGFKNWQSQQQTLWSIPTLLHTKTIAPPPSWPMPSDKPSLYACYQCAAVSPLAVYVRHFPFVLSKSHTQPQNQSMVNRARDTEAMRVSRLW